MYHEQSSLGVQYDRYHVIQLTRESHLERFDNDQCEYWSQQSWKTRLTFNRDAIGRKLTGRNQFSSDLVYLHGASVAHVEGSILDTSRIRNRIAPAQCGSRDALLTLA